MLDSVSNTLRSRREVIDFGILKNSGDKSYVDMWLENTGDTDINIIEVILEEPDPNVQIIPVATVVYAQKGAEYLVANLILTAEVGDVQEVERVSRRNILVFTDNSNPVLAVLKVPYEASVRLGGIIMEEEISTVTDDYYQTNGVDDYNSNSGTRNVAPTDEIFGDRISLKFTKLDSGDLQNIFLLSPSGCQSKTNSTAVCFPFIRPPKTIIQKSLKSTTTIPKTVEKTVVDNHSKVEDKVAEGKNKEFNNYFESSYGLASNEQNVTREYHLKNVFPVPVRLMSVSTSSCHETFSVHTSFLKDTFSSESVRAPLRSKPQSSEEGNESNKNLITDEGETEVESEVEVEIEEGGDRFYPSSVAQSGSKWPAISITFHREIALTRATLAEQSTQTSLSAIRPQGVWGRQIYPQTCWLEIWSNKSTHRFPLHIIDGGVRLAYADAVRPLIMHSGLNF